MTRDVVSVSPSMSVEDLVKFMFEKKHMGYPVMEGDNLKGIVTFTDIHRIPYIDRPVSQVSDIMSRNVISVPPDAQASDVLKLITSKNIGRVIVIDNGSVIGILSRTDLVRVLKLRSE
jgi:CBS domain-containing protein